jgi:hypothetical protein
MQKILVTALNRDNKKLIKAFSIQKKTATYLMKFEDMGKSTYAASAHDVYDITPNIQLAHRFLSRKAALGWKAARMKELKLDGYTTKKWLVVPQQRGKR